MTVKGSTCPMRTTSHKHAEKEHFIQLPLHLFHFYALALKVNFGMGENATLGFPQFLQTNFVLTCTKNGQKRQVNQPNEGMYITVNLVEPHLFFTFEVIIKFHAL